MIDLLRIHRRKQIRNGDVFRTALCAITAGGTRNQMLASENLLHLFNCIECCLISKHSQFYL